MVRLNALSIPLHHRSVVGCRPRRPSFHVFGTLFAATRTFLSLWRGPGGPPRAIGLVPRPCGPGRPAGPTEAYSGRFGLYLTEIKAVMWQFITNCHILPRVIMWVTSPI